MAKTSFHLGGVVDPESGDRTDDMVRYEADDLTTHGVIVGMTGSGKTGLGIIFIEEALRSGMPVLVLDPKGDMTNLALTFPDLAPTDFEPWVDAGQARREDTSVEDLAASTADLWKSGLDSWGLDGSDLAALSDAADVTIYTPGSQAGVPLNILGSLAAPDVDWVDDAEAARDEIEGLVSGLLALVGVDSDPLSSREHILLSNLVERAWREGSDLTLESLIGAIHRPPMRKLGVFELDSFFPEKDRLALAMRLNALVASPSFADWRSGPALDVGRLLWDESGKPQASVIYLAHLSDEERQFVVAMVLGRLITWMRSQPGSSDLRALVYMDEVFGFVPPTASPPAKKPILTILKQARAFGIGMILSTQNPVDLDYKAMSNAGTWCIGRLQTERDKSRILEALQSASGATDVDVFDNLISDLGKRTFVLHNTRDRQPTVFTTRWAMSYLRGPLTREELSRITDEDPRRQESNVNADPAPAPIADDASTVQPDVASGIAVRYLDPAAPWADEIGASRSGTTFAPALAARVHLTFDDRTAQIDHDEQWEAVYFPLEERFDAGAGIAADYDERDLRPDPPDGATYVLSDAPIQTKQWFTAAEREIKDELYRNRQVEVFRNRSLKAYGRVGETSEAFATRCRSLADDGADAAVAKLKDRFETRIDRARDQLNRALEKVDDARLDVDTRRQEEFVSGAGTVLGVLLGRRSTRSMSAASRKRSMTRKAQQRLDTAQRKVIEEREDLDEIEVDMSDAVSEIVSEWQTKADDIETLEVGLEKTDIKVDDLTLVWVPIEQ
jgi:DNA helicase HerA-like ATPase